MADIKATSFRINEDDIVKFKEFADKEGYNQAEAFKSIMQTVEMAKAKNMIKDRAKEIEVFQDTINNLMSMFLNSLNVNQTSEERIREELSQELQTKDNTISTMYDQLQEVKSYNKSLKDNNKELNDDIKEFNEHIKKFNIDIVDKQKNIDKLNSNNDLLQEQLQEYKHYKEQYKQLENDIEKLKSDIVKKDVVIQGMTTDNQQLKDKVKNDNDMINFYKNEISNKDKSIEEYKSNIKALEEKYNNQIQQIKADYEKLIKDQLDNAINNLNNKHEIELSKKDLEIQKLNNQIDQLQTTTKKRTVKEEK